MKIVYKIDKKYLGHPHWRLSININTTDSIIVRVENYEWGFLDGEEWDKIFISSKYGGNSYLVSLMTKSSYEELMKRYDEVVDVFYNNLFLIEDRLNKSFSIEKRTYESNINKLNSVRSSDLFKNIYREEKIKEVLNGN